MSELWVPTEFLRSISASPEAFCFTLMVIMSQSIDLLCTLHTDVWVPGNWLALQAHFSLYKHNSCKGLSVNREEVKEQGGGQTEQCPFYSSNLGRLPGGHLLGKDGWSESMEFCCQRLLLLLHILHSFTQRGLLSSCYQALQLGSQTPEFKSQFRH